MAFVVSQQVTSLPNFSPELLPVDPFYISLVFFYSMLLDSDCMGTECNRQIRLTLILLWIVPTFIAFNKQIPFCQNVVRTKKVAHRAIAKCVTDVLASFWHLPWCYWTLEHGIYLLKIVNRQIIQNVNQKTRQAYPFPTLTNFGNTAVIWSKLLSIQNEANSLVALQIHKLWLVQI